jgi:hypothetical protein
MSGIQNTAVQASDLLILLLIQNCLLEKKNFKIFMGCGYSPLKREVPKGGLA